MTGSNLCVWEFEIEFEVVVWVIISPSVSSLFHRSLTHYHEIIQYLLLQRDMINSYQQPNVYTMFDMISPYGSQKCFTVNTGRKSVFFRSMGEAQTFPMLYKPSSTSEAAGTEWAQKPPASGISKSSRRQESFM